LTSSVKVFLSPREAKISKLPKRIKHHFSHLGEPSKKTYLAFFKEIVETTRKMVVDWQRVGFVHGVMNTDNMSIHGVTIDFGPYGWLEDYDESWTPNTTDAQNRRYRFGNQPSVALWNLTQLANALYPLIEEVEPLQEILDYYKSQYQLNYLLIMLEKIGVFTFDKGDEKLIDDLIKNLSESEMDFTLFFRNLNRFDSKNKENHLKLIEKDSYLSKIELDRQINSWSAWLDSYSKRLKKETISNKKKIEKTNSEAPALESQYFNRPQKNKGKKTSSQIVECNDSQIKLTSSPLHEGGSAHVQVKIHDSDEVC